jgi:hypothetical protein
MGSDLSLFGMAKARYKRRRDDLFKILADDLITLDETADRILGLIRLPESIEVTKMQLHVQDARADTILPSIKGAKGRGPAHSKDDLNADPPETPITTIRQLHDKFGKVQQWKTRRHEYIKSLGERCLADDIEVSLGDEIKRLEELGGDLGLCHLEDFLGKRLDSLYGDDIKYVDKEKDEQETNLTEFMRLYREFRELNNKN